MNFTYFKLLIISFSVSCILFQTLAVPAIKKPVTIEQPDGTFLTFFLYGDEHFNYRTTTDGYLIEQKQDGFFYYTDIENGVIFSSMRVNEMSKRTTEEIAYTRRLKTENIFNALKEVSGLNPGFRFSDFRIGGNYPTTGSPKGLIILVEFSDNSFTVENPNQAFTDLLMKEGYSENGATGSASDYYKASSSGLFTPIFDVYGPVKLKNPISYYGKNDYWGNDSAPAEMVRDACLLLEDEIDFSEYDVDGDGIVDNVFVFYAGYNEAEGGPANTIWPHQWSLTYGRIPLFLDGVMIDSYACTSELKGSKGNTMCGIGTFTHEFCHVMGLPDLYNTNNDYRCFTPGEWSILAYGPYNNEGRTPPYMTVYERYCLGWLEPVELNAAAVVDMRDISYNEGFIIRTDNPDEYYLFENRQQIGWDTYIPGHGMLVWHIDYDVRYWEANTVNNTYNHQRVDIVEADNIQTQNTYDGDTFPGANKVISFTDDTTPSMKDWSGNALGKPITEITEKNRQISFRFMDGKLTETVKAKAATDITQTGFTANWESIGQTVTEYIVKIYPITEQRDTKPKIIAVKNNTANGIETTLTCQIEGILEPGTGYYYTVTAINPFEETGKSESISFTTLEPTFKFFSPVAGEAKDVTDETFTANWLKMDEAVSYYIDVYEKQEINPVQEIIDFTGGVSSLPQGWSTNAAIISSSGYHGKESPALSFNKEETYLESPLYEKPITYVEFFYRGFSEITAGTHSFEVYGYNGDKWLALYKNNDIDTAGEGEAVILPEDKLDNIFSLRFTFERTTSQGFIILDDIWIEYEDTEIIEYVEGYENREVGHVFTYQVTGLEAETTYYYTVKGSDRTVLSRQSNEIKVISAPTSIQEKSYNSNQIFIKDNILYIRTDSNYTQETEIYDVLGKLVLKDTLNREIQVDMNKFVKGIYVVKTGNDVYKIIL